MTKFIAACGHEADARDIGRICEQCFANTHAELAALRAQLAEVTRERDGLRAAIQDVIAKYPWVTAIRVMLEKAMESKP